MSEKEKVEEERKVRALIIEAIIAGIILILIGLIKILGIPWEEAWPYLLIAIGCIILGFAIYAWKTGKKVIAEKYE